MNYQSRQRLDGKVVLLTGAAGILGREFAAGYCEMGASIVLVDIDKETVNAVASELAKTYGVKTLGISCDVTSSESVEKMTDEAIAEFAEIHVLHNNAATKGTDVRAFFAPFEDYSLEVWRQVMSVNIDGMFLVAQSVGRRMLQQKTGGSVVQTGSIYGLVGPDSRIYEGSEYLGGEINTPAVYAASKSAVIGLTRYLATRWAAHNIRVNCLVPGGVESGQNSEFSDRYSERVPLGRMARSEEVVSAALFLASEASSYVTGQVLAVDGGWTCW